MASSGTGTVSNSTISSNSVTGGAGGAGATGDTGGTGGTGSDGAGGHCSYNWGGARYDCSSASNGGTGGTGGAGSPAGPGGAGGDGKGGGIYIQGALTVRNSTLTDNWASGGSGGAGGRGGNGGAGGRGGKGGNGDEAGTSACTRGADGGRGGTGGRGGAGGSGLGAAIFSDATLNLAFATVSHNLPSVGSVGSGGSAGSGGAGGEKGYQRRCGDGNWGNTGATGGNGSPGGNGAGGQAAGAGIYRGGGTAKVKNTIIGQNGPGGDCAGNPVTSEGYNLIHATCGFGATGDMQGADPKLDALRDNGGPTDTRALLSGSPAIGKIPNGTNDCGSAALGLDRDQRGQVRPQNGFCDMGAFQTPLGPPRVTTTDDEYGENRGQCSLREAIQAANTDAPFGGCLPGGGADTISVPAGLYRLTRAGAGEDNNATGDLDITAPLILTGAGQARTYIDANSLDRAFHILGSAVTINNMTVRNGRADNGGGINVAAAAALIVSNSILSGNAATNQGGGVFAAGALIVNNCTVSGNTAAADGGGLHVRNSTATVSGSTFSGNTTQASGGAIFNTNSTATVGSSTIFSNTAQVNGGGIYSGSAVTVTASTLDSNRTGNWGGGIFVNDGAAHIISSTVRGNTAVNQGGGIYINNGATAIGASAIFSNTADAAGGGIFVNSGATNVRNSTISNNTAGQGGGARVAGGRLILLFTTLAWNAAASDQGAHLSNSGAITLTATALAEAQGGVSCAGTAPASGGYNRISDASCLLTTGSDIADATILLQPLADNKGPTQTHMPDMVAGTIRSWILCRRPSASSGWGPTPPTSAGSRGRNR